MSEPKYETRIELGPDGETMIESTYNLNGDYIGDVETAKYLCDERGIAPEVLKPGANVCSIGFCEREQKWYGWSHRAIYGFGVGDSVKKGDCGYVAGSPEDLVEQHIAFFADDILYPDAERRNAKAEELRAQCQILPHNRGILINDPGIVADAVVLGSMDKISDALAALEAADHIKPEPTQLIEPHQQVVLCGRGEWTAETLDDAKQMACDFADSVS
jgi:hypothetical protein